MNRMLRLFIIYVFICSCTVLKALDSLEIHQQLQILANAPDTQKLRLYNDLVWELRKIDNQQATRLAQDGIALAQEINDTLNLYKLHSKLGLLYVYQRKFSEGVIILDESLAYFQKSAPSAELVHALSRRGYAANRIGNFSVGDSLYSSAYSLCSLVADSLFLKQMIWQNRGVNYWSWRKLDQARNAYKEGLTISELREDDEATSNILGNLGILEKTQNNFALGLEYYLQALEKDPGKVPHNTANILNNIGILYNEMEEWETALSYHERALTIRKTLNLPHLIASSLHNMGIVHYMKTNYGEALRYFQQSYDIKVNLEGNNNGLGDIINSLGNIYLELGEIRKAIEYFERYLQIERETNDPFGECRALTNLAAAYQKEAAFRRAIQYGEQAYYLGKQLNAHRLIMQVSATLKESYADLQDYKKAHFYTNEHWIYRDSLWGEEKALAISQLEMKYQVGQKEDSLALAQEQLISLAQRKEIDKLRIQILGLVVLILGVVAVAVAYFYRKKQQEWAAQQASKEQVIDQIKQENTSLKAENTRQQTELENYLKQLLEKSEYLLEIREEQLQQAAELDMDDTHHLLTEGFKNQQGTQKFEYFFSKVHKDFFKKLNNLHPQLSTYDLNLCALLKLNLNNKEIAQILGISPDSVKKARQRLYAKMGLGDNEALRRFVLQL